MTGLVLHADARAAGEIAPARVILHDHARLPARFFGRLTACVQADLRA